MSTVCFPLRDATRDLEHGLYVEVVALLREGGGGGRGVPIVNKLSFSSNESIA